MNNSNKNLLVDITVVSHRSMLTAIVVFAMMSVYALPASALGIGEAKIVSNLFEPLRVDVPIDAGVVDASELNVRLMIISDGDVANPSAAGEMPGLQREIITAADGQRILRVTSSQPVLEPVLTLRVDLSGNSLQMRKDLTLLFDPPGHVVEPAIQTAAVKEPIQRVEPAPVTVIAQETIEAPKATIAPVAAAVVSAPPLEPVPIAAAPVADVKPPVPTRPARAPRERTEIVRNETDHWLRYGPVRADENLEAIAEQTRGSQNIPVPMMAMLLRWLNPAAFNTTDGQLRVGATLKFPSPDSLASQMAATGTVWTTDSSAVAAAPIAPQSTSLQMVSSLSADSLGQIANIDAAAQVAVVESIAPEPAPVHDPVVEPDDSNALAAIVAAPVAANAGTTTSSGAPSSGIAPTVAAAAFPTWLIGLALVLSVLTVGFMMRVLRATPVPVAAYPERPALTRSYVVNPMLEQSPQPARPSLPPVAGSAEDSIVVSDTDWDLEMFDLLRAESDVVPSKIDTAAEKKNSPTRKHPGDADAARDWQA